MQIVNGFLCMNCCDVDKARLGQDPHQSTNQIRKELQKLIDHKLDPLAPDNFGPAVTFGGSLPSAADDATGAAANGPTADQQPARSGIDVVA